MTAESLTLAASSERTFAGSMTCGGIGRGHPRYRSPRYYIMCIMRNTMWSHRHRPGAVGPASAPATQSWPPAAAAGVTHGSDRERPPATLPGPPVLPECLRRALTAAGLLIGLLGGEDHAERRRTSRACRNYPKYFLSRGSACAGLSRCAGRGI